MRYSGERGRTQHALLAVLELEVLVRELLPIDALATRTVVVCEVTSLTHEILDHTVERRALVAIAVLSCR